MTLGEYLQQQRELRGVTLAEIAEHTKIRESQLEFLEADQWGKLPESPFLKGFVSSYCSHLGLPVDQVMLEFGDVFEQIERDRPARTRVHGGYTFEQSRRAPSPLIFVIFLVIIMLVTGIFFGRDYLTDNSLTSWLQTLNQKTPEPTPGGAPKQFSQTYGNPEKTAVPDPPTPSPTGISAAQQLVTPSPSPTPETVKPTATIKPDPTLLSVEPSRKPRTVDPLSKGDTLPVDKIYYKLVLKAKRDIWLRYKVDQNPVKKYRLLEGRVMVFRAEFWIACQIADGNAVLARIDQNRDYSALKKIVSLQTINAADSFTHPKQARHRLATFFGELDGLPKNPPE